MSSPFLPFLYQTRTLLRRPVTVGLLSSRGFRSPRRTPTPRTPSRRTPRRTTDSSSANDSIPFEFGPDQVHAAATVRRQADSATTITEAEKRVFDEIFGDISKRRRNMGPAALAAQMPLGADLDLDAPVQRVLSRFGPGPLDPDEEEAPAGVKSEQELRREKILAMYPPALRRAAESALGLQEDTTDGITESAGVRSPSIPAESPEELEAARRQEEAATAESARLAAQLAAFQQAEKARVLALMRSCESDVKLWEVLETEVFSMVQRLGIGRSKAIPATSLPMEDYGPLYSVYLLSALRVLDREFVEPSRLALNVLPRVMELGMASYVLGVSTRFYNELMSIYWYRYGDGEAVLRLLKEMERAGLSGDNHTLKIVDAVYLAIEGVNRDDEPQSPFAAVARTMPEYDVIMAGKLKERRKWVLDSIQGRADELPY